MKKLLLLPLVLAGVWWVFLCHCLPADTTVRRELGHLRVNAFVEMNGFLVEVQKDGADQPWRNSLVRDDEGGGACEVFWITDIAELTP